MSRRLSTQEYEEQDSWIGKLKDRWFGEAEDEEEIDEAFRGRGLGRAAMVFAEQEAQRLGIAKVALNVFGGNEVARGLYRSLGYAETAVHMEKRV